VIGKIFLVFTFVASVLLAGVSMIAFFAVPSMQVAMSELQNHSFEAQISDKVTWNVTRRLGDGGNVVSAVNEFDAVTKARGDDRQRMQTEFTELSDRQATVVAQTTQIKADQQRDIAALQQSIEDKQTLVSSKDNEVKAQSAEFQNLSVQAKAAWAEGASRREDIIRMSAELGVLQTEVYQLNELHRTLVDRLLRIRMDTERLQLRETQLQKQMSGS
jgi:chromosome segregation ATPase